MLLRKDSGHSAFFRAWIHTQAAKHIIAFTQLPNEVFVTTSSSQQNALMVVKKRNKRGRDGHLRETEPVAQQQQQPELSLMAAPEMLMNTKKPTSELIAMCRELGLLQRGPKPLLCWRLYCWQMYSNAAVKLQRYIRGCFARIVIKEAKRFVNQLTCKENNVINDTDFLTLEPIREVNALELYVYSDNSKNVYAFPLQSIFPLIVQRRYGHKMAVNTNALNPYNRQPFGDAVCMDVMRVVMNRVRLNYAPIVSLYKSTQRCLLAQIIQQQLRHHHQDRQNVTAGSVYRQRQIPWPLYVQWRAVTNTLSIGHLHFEERSQQSMAVTLFQFCNRVGYYVDAAWFMNLSVIALFSYMKRLEECYNVNMTDAETRLQICPLWNGNPFTWWIKYQQFLIHHYNWQRCTSTAHTPPSILIDDQLLEVREIALRVLFHLFVHTEDTSLLYVSATYMLMILAQFSREAEIALPMLL